MFLSLQFNFSIAKIVYYRLYDVDEITGKDYYYFCSKEVDENENINSNWMLVQEEIRIGNCPERYYSGDFIQCRQLKFDNYINLNNNNLRKCLKQLQSIREEFQWRRKGNYNMINFYTNEKIKDNTGKFFSIRVIPYDKFDNPFYELQIIKKHMNYKVCSKYYYLIFLILNTLLILYLVYLSAI